ncbi:MAG: hypothetical protein MJ025_00900 [Victivallaceae bacterium]|nr:hypothetical protein [Victivallaceae bacterium]
MTDIHSHILPGLDDGSDSPERSKEMLAAAARTGVRRLAATSHYSVRCEENYDRVFQETAQMAAACGIELIPGMEYDFDRIGGLDVLSLRTVGGGDFVLVDMKQPYVSDGSVSWMFNAGLNGRRVIVAHPERLWKLGWKECYERLPELGCALQINSGSILGRYGADVMFAAWKLLQQNVYCMVADDAHHEESFCMDEARNALSEFFPKDAVDIWFDYNPEAVVSGRILRATKARLGFAARLRWRLAHGCFVGIAGMESWH